MNFDSNFNSEEPRIFALTKLKLGDRPGQGNAVAFLTVLQEGFVLVNVATVVLASNKIAKDGFEHFPFKNGFKMDEGSLDDLGTVSSVKFQFTERRIAYRL